MNALRHEAANGVGLRPSGRLIDRALARLAHGPTATEVLAREILALRGNPRAAAAAVFTLLGSDPRVEVDADGVWSLVATSSPLPAALRDQPWVVVDIETTGGSPYRGHRVVEVAAVHIAGGKLCGSYSTLVDPSRAIPRFITALTGISERMVAGAPRFEEIVPRLVGELGGSVFVGHNASFDWRFLSAELERCTGQCLAGRRVCTLRLARRLAPHLPSRSLGALAHYYGVKMTSHHRALDDAVATAHLLLILLEALEEQGIVDWPGLEACLARRAPRLRRIRRPRSMTWA